MSERVPHFPPWLSLRLTAGIEAPEIVEPLTGEEVDLIRAECERVGVDLRDWLMDPSWTTKATIMCTRPHVMAKIVGVSDA